MTADTPAAPYDRRAAVYDHLVRSRIYNRLAWAASPDDYARFASAAFASSAGPLLEVAAGSAAATAELHAHSQRQTVLVDQSDAMLQRAARRIAAASPGPHIPARVHFVRADIMALPPLPAQQFTTIVGLGLTHLASDLAGLARVLRERLAPGGQLYLAGLVTGTRRGAWYLKTLHRAGEVCEPRTAGQMRAALGHPAKFYTTGCMAYATLGA